MVNPTWSAWARETAGFSLSDAAKRLKIDEAVLETWEDAKSDGAPTIPQLRKLASLFKRPLAVFYLEEAPQHFQVMRDLRRLPGAGPRQYSPGCATGNPRGE